MKYSRKIGAGGQFWVHILYTFSFLDIFCDFSYIKEFFSEAHFSKIIMKQNDNEVKYTGNRYRTFFISMIHFLKKKKDGAI